MLLWDSHRGVVPMPPHAYVPGQNMRHPEGLFDGVKQSVHAELTPESLHETEAFRAGLIYFDAGFYWECHEVLEAVWMQAPDGSPEREMVQALIQLANAKLKILMQRPNAARRLCDKVSAHVGRCPQGLMILGLYPGQVLACAEQLRQCLESEFVYYTA
ncbi:DUF309 domain-containing protein [Sulfitobacter sp. F26204]|uniref:DUF309 domain-containing protein n=1 Tax=Sulfitobacter sp. F26204 TaxID=2996014 RepID=UPI00225E47AC|nr:DUF309 domain-containing protein [Sulfitobacter sp. F26204]MCX7558590.1 DUF309 domain-containing protein [Sulfitobacter sp. F26204]